MSAGVDVENNEYIILSNFGGRFMSKLLRGAPRSLHGFLAKIKAQSENCFYSNPLDFFYLKLLCFIYHFETIFICSENDPFPIQLRSSAAGPFCDKNSS